MSTVKVSVKWQSEVFNDVEVDQSSPIELLNAQLFGLTNVPPERQKIMLKGRILKTDGDIARIGDGGRLVLMGSADELVAAPTTAVLFEEDLTDSQRANFGTVDVPCGLRNLGNTCYLNSAIECFRAIPELKENLITYGGGGDATRFDSAGSTSAPNPIVAKMGQMMRSLDNSVDAVAPLAFLTAFREGFPQFAQRTANGYSQQDADESLTQILYSLQQVMKKFPSEPSVTASSGINGMFKGYMESRITCNEMQEEEKQSSDIAPEVKSHEFTKLCCHISNETNHLTDGLQAALSETIEKHSPVLNRNALFTKVDRISQLPPYLIVQFVRFFWKKDTQKKAKIMRKVVFPMRLDVFQYCTTELQAKLSAHRDEADKKFEAEQAAKESAPLEFKSKKEIEAEVKPAITVNPRLCVDSGMYELFALVTHKGRAADSGHYIGWARGPNKGEWFQYDDDVVTKQKDDDIQKLFGGGDWHMAYLCFYRATTWRA